MTRRLLMIAYYFPPLGGIGSLRAVRYVRHLPEFGWEVSVLAPDRGGSYRDDQLEVPPTKLVRSRAVDLSAAGKRALRVPGPNGPAVPSNGLHALARTAAHRWLYFPDAQIGWYPGGVTAGARMLRRQRFDAILSSSQPITGHLIARTLRRRSAVPWIAEFRDPWADRLDSGPRTLRRAAALESRLAREADALVMPSWTWAARYERLWERQIAAIPNGCDEELPEPAPPAERVLTYVGSFYPGLQDLSSLWGVMARAREARWPPLRLRDVGVLPRELRDEIAAHRVSDLIEETGYVPHAEALRISACSSGLLMAGPVVGDEMSRGVIPAKVFEYLASGLPVIYVGDPESDVARVLHGQPECHLIAAGAGVDLEVALARCDGRTVRRDVSAFSARRQAESMAALLGELMGDRG
jgi:glycosyltransferase involved in cell wall biosynthesis